MRCIKPSCEEPWLTDHHTHLAERVNGLLLHWLWRMQHAIRQAPFPLTERPLVAEQLLAAAVLGQAVRDATDRHSSERRRAAALSFLFDRSESLRFWTAMAGLDAQLVREQAQQLLSSRTSPGDA
jgi:hypothetical protein